MVEGGMKCVKILLFVFNFIFVLAGIALIAAGSYVLVEFKEYLQLVEGNYTSAAALLIAVGVLIFIIAAFGCCGAWKENHICVMIFAVLLTIIFILEIAGGIAGYVLKDKVEDGVRTLMKDAQEKYSEVKSDQELWDLVQKEFKCCGVNNVTSWAGHLGTNSSNVVPKSCCNSKYKDTCTGTQADVEAGHIYTDDCLNAFVTWMKDRIFIVGGVGIGLAFVQIVGILFACCLARALRKEYEVV